MNRSTERILNEINRRFYREHAEAFATTRHAPWGGWDRLLGPLEAGLPSSIRVLDAGCGNGRFGDFLAGSWPGRVLYTGIDSSTALLKIAEARLAGKVELDLRLWDFVEEPLPSFRSAGGFDLAVAFGVLHHMPGREQRFRLLEALAQLLAPGGFLVCSIWLFGRDERFRRRLLDWQSLPAELGSVDPSELEEGDHLLRWGQAPGTLRYCHALSDAEEQEWLDGLGLDLVERYEADGRGGHLNRYLVFRRSVDSGHRETDVR